MQSLSLLSLTSISQWTLFSGIALTLLGLMENRERFSWGGHLIFLLLGFFALFILLTNRISVPEVEENSVSKAMKVMTYFKLTSIFAALNTIPLLLKLFKLRFLKTSQYIIVILAMLLFFMVFNIQQMAS